jgi:dynein heavy chain
VISKDQAEADLALQEAVPALEAAAEALKVLDPKKLTEVRSFTTPPPAVQDTCMCVLILKPLGSDNPPDSDGWAGAKAMLASTNLLNRIRGYEKNNITNGMYKKICEYFKKPTFTQENIRNVSQAAANLYMWVEAMKKYYEVNRKIEPLRKSLKLANAKLEAA